MYKIELFFVTVFCVLYENAKFYLKKIKLVKGNQTSEVPVQKWS